MALRPGTPVGPSEVVALVGAGNMGEVSEARNPRLNRLVALKIIPDDLAADARRRERFRREAQAIAALSHPNIVTIYEAEDIEGRLVIAMELVDGRTLAELIPRGGFPIDRQLKLAVQMAEALGAAHERGIIHRDFKPRNVMVGDDGRVKVLDFGLATLRAAAPNAAHSHATSPLWELTAEGHIVGTAAYMSPEQADGRPLNHRTDLFSLGIVLHEMAVGERPFQGDSVVSILAAIVRDTPRPLTGRSNRRLPRELARVVRRCLAKDREERYQSARDLGHDLNHLRQELRSGESGERVAVQAERRRRGSWILAGVALGLVVAGLAAAATASRWRRASASVPRPVETLQLTFEPGVESSPSISPDGRWIVLHASRRAQERYLPESRRRRSAHQPHGGIGTRQRPGDVLVRWRAHRVSIGATGWRAVRHGSHRRVRPPRERRRIQSGVVPGRQGPRLMPRFEAVRQTPTRTLGRLDAVARARRQRGAAATRVGRRRPARMVARGPADCLLGHRPRHASSGHLDGRRDLAAHRCR